jgi:hypothetical protein
MQEPADLQKKITIVYGDGGPPKALGLILRDGCVHGRHRRGISAGKGARYF